MIYNKSKIELVAATMMGVVKMTVVTIETIVAGLVASTIIVVVAWCGERWKQRLSYPIAF